MLSFFPTPYPDELLYSILARYHIRSGNKAAKTTMQELFGSRYAIATADLPCNLAALAKNLSFLSGVSAEAFIQKHTLYPFYAPFLPLERSRQVLEALKSDHGGSIHDQIGIRASVIKAPKFLRFCPQCAEQDKETFGELYWHRVHQAPGILMCPHHKVMLQNSQVPYQGLNRHEYIAASHQNCLPQPTQFSLSLETSPVLTDLSQDAFYLLEHSLASCDAQWFRQQYITLLIERRLATVTGRVHQRDLLHQFRYCCGKAVLEALDSDVAEDGDHTWLASIVRKHRKAFHPIRHLLMMRFLEVSVEAFFEHSDRNYRPFGQGPWPCLNTAAEHHLKPVVTALKISLCGDTKKPVGTFTCECGFVYCRTGPDEKESDSHQIGKIKAVGPVWQQKLKHLVEGEQLGLRAIARELQVDPRTVNRYVDILKLCPQWRSPAEAEQANQPQPSAFQANVSTNVKAQQRERWQTLKIHHPQASKTALRRMAPGTYMWLYRHDCKWLQQNSPLPRTTTISNNRVDWQERDFQILAQVQAAVDLLLAIEKPVRVTISRVAKTIGHLALIEQHLDQMPQTKAYLDSVVETVEAFQVHRVRWAAKQLDEQGTAVEAWKIVRQAGLGSTSSEVVSKVIEQEVKIRLRIQNSTLVKFVP